MIFTLVDGLVRDDAIHSPILEKTKLEDTPAYKNSVKRFVGLGLTEEEAGALLKGQ